MNAKYVGIDNQDRTGARVYSFDLYFDCVLFCIMFGAHMTGYMCRGKFHAYIL